MSLARFVRSVTIISETNTPLYSKTFNDNGAADADEEMRYLYISHAALDIVEEKCSSATGLDMYLGLLYPTDNYQAFGYVSNTKTKIIVVIEDADVKDVDVKSLLRRIHSAFVDALCNPFHVPGDRINSPRFDKDRCELNAINESLAMSHCY